MGIFLSLGHIIPFLRIPYFYEFGKNADSVKWVWGAVAVLRSIQLVWRQWEFAFFGALTTVGALFI